MCTRALKQEPTWRGATIASRVNDTGFAKIVVNMPAEAILPGFIRLPIDREGNYFSVKITEDTSSTTCYTCAQTWHLRVNCPKAKRKRPSTNGSYSSQIDAPLHNNSIGQGQIDPNPNQKIPDATINSQNHGQGKWDCLLQQSSSSPAVKKRKEHMDPMMVEAAPTTSLPGPPTAGPANRMLIRYPLVHSSRPPAHHQTTDLNPRKGGSNIAINPVIARNCARNCARLRSFPSLVLRGCSQLQTVADPKATCITG